jgi:hypothetical protein
MAVSKQGLHKFYMGRPNVKKLNKVEDKVQDHVPKRFAAL